MSKTDIVIYKQETLKPAGSSIPAGFKKAGYWEIITYRRGAVVLFLSELVKDVNILKIDGNDQVDIKGITYDSRLVMPGFLFVAVEGLRSDGHDYISQAVEAGASAVLVQKNIDVSAEVTRLRVENSREALAQISATFYQVPALKMRMIGVTGTNGKTTTTNLISAIYRSSGYKVGLIGTIANYIGDKKLDVSHTTPESTDLQQLLCDMVEEKVDVAVLEVSSHALSLERVTGCEFDVAVFTNLTQDHLDFHRDMDDYLASKLKLFKSIGPGIKKGLKYVVLNKDDPYAERIIPVVKVPLITYGVYGEADVKALNIKVKAGGCSFTVKGKNWSADLNMKITGLFNVYNTLAAFAVGVAAGFTPDRIVSALQSMKCVPGRFELVDYGQDFTVVVDYAHTPDGLENILKTARSITSRRLITVFGCGGDRDRKKRPIMGEISGSYSDFSIITSDNPRTEDPLKIISDVQEGIKKLTDSGRYTVMPDRREAIKTAILMAKKGDLVVIAGKGHEDYQIIGRQKLHFDDREEAGKVLKLLKESSIKVNQVKD